MAAFGAVGSAGPRKPAVVVSVLLPWGKWTGYARPLPLLAHLLDTAAVALAAWPALSAQVRRNAVAVLAPDRDAALAAARFALLAAVHDTGKLDPVFQGQRWSPRAADFEGHVAALRAAGLEVPARRQRPYGPGDAAAGHFRHEAMTAYLLGRHSDLPVWARQVVAGHHGRYQPAESGFDCPVALHELRAGADAGPWAVLQRAVLGSLVRAVGAATGQPVGLADWPMRLPSRQVAFLPVLTGLVCVCDWVASDDRFVAAAPVEVLGGDPLAYLRRRRAGAGESLRELWGEHAVPAGGFAELFDGYVPRGAAQEWAVASEHGAGLTVVMVPMGEGKTEMALWMHSSGVAPGEGLYVGLPTMATADAMFGRIAAFWAGTDSVGRLAQSRL